MIDTKKWSLLASSVCMYWLAFLSSAWMWWAVFFSFIPLYVISDSRRLSFKEGFFYGILLWGLLVGGVFYSIVIAAQGHLIVRLLPVILIVLYQAFFTGVWFWVTQKLEHLLGLVSPAAKLMLWGLTTTCYFYWATTWSLTPFNNAEGYFFIHPLLPLAEHPVFLGLMHSIGTWPLTFFLMAANVLFTLPFLGYNMWFAFTGILPWSISLGTGLSFAPLPEPTWARRIAHIPHIFLSGYNVMDLAETVEEKIKELLKRHPQTELIILPESSFDRINLNTAREVGQVWDTVHLSKPIHLLIGAFNWNGNKYHNAVYWFYDGKLQSIFNKRHAMLLTEGLAPWYDMAWVRSLYHQVIPPLSPSTNARIPFQIFKGVSFVPYICSELFFNDKPDDVYPDSVIISLCNDNWSLVGHVRRLMFLGARFKAIAWQRDIVYASYHYNGIINKLGAFVPLNK